MAPALLTHFLKLNDSYFVSVRDFQHGQLVFRFNGQGETLNADTLALGECFYSYSHNGEPRMVSLQYDISDHWIVRTVLYEFDSAGEFRDSVLLRTAELAQGENIAGYTFNYAHGILTCMAASVTPGSPLNEFRVWFTRYDDETATHTEPWNPGPLPAGTYVTMWGVMRASDGQAVLAAYLRGDEIKELWFLGLDAGYMFNDNLHIQPVDVANSLNGLKLMEYAGSVFYVFTEVTADGSSGGATKVAAFPLSTLLDADETTPLLPNSIELRAYPNPFNASTTLEFALSHAGLAELAVYDVLGRKVEQLTRREFAPGAQRVTWNANAAASGKYFVRLTTNYESHVLPIVLTK